MWKTLNQENTPAIRKPISTKPEHDAVETGRYDCLFRVEFGNASRVGSVLGSHHLVRKFGLRGSIALPWFGSVELPLRPCFNCIVPAKMTK
jgi:hypothetical protein